MTEEVDSAAPAAHARQPMTSPEPRSDRQGDSVREDFLFHLYRGSELLYDSRPLEAKSELEHALTLEPNDPRGRALLAVVYFRIGQFAPASALYEALLVEQPDDLAIRVNLALCELKAGKPEPAHVHLRRVVETDPTHLRAWGYLGVALERLGLLDEAHVAFGHAGQHDMARRMLERGAAKRPEPAEPTQSPRGPRVEDLDAGELNLGLAAASTVSPPALALVPQVHLPQARRLDTLDWGASPPRGAAAWLEPPALVDFLTDARLERRPQGRTVSVLANRLARIEIDGAPSAVGFALRLDALRSFAGDLDPDVLSRQSRGSGDGETFGGVGTPFVSFRGPGLAVLGPRPSQRVVAFEMQNGVLFMRREALLGFELSLTYENGRLHLGDGEAAPLVQLQGDGAVLLELATELIALDVHAGGNLTVRKEVLVGWVGRLLPRTLTTGEAPCGQRGLIAFSGEGTLLVARK